MTTSPTLSRGMARTAELEARRAEMPDAAKVALNAYILGALVSLATDEQWRVSLDVALSCMAADPMPEVQGAVR